MKIKPIIKVMIFLLATLFFTNCKKNSGNKPVTPIPPAGTGSVTVGGVTYTGTCKLLPGGEVQIINLSIPTPFLLRVLGMPLQSSGKVVFNRNTTGGLTAVYTQNSIQYEPGDADVGQVTKIGPNSFTFSCTLYTAPPGPGGNPGTVPFYLTGGGTY